MFAKKQVINHVKRFKMSNIYLSPAEIKDCVANLTPKEFLLYVELKQSVLKNVSPEYFDSKNLAKLIGVSDVSFPSIKANLKKKGYAMIFKFKDEDGLPMVRLVVGKDEVELYNLGLRVEITDAAAYNKLIKMFPVNDPTLSLDERKDLVEQYNAYYQAHKEQFE